MSPTLVAIEISGRSRRARTLVFDDGTERTTAAAVVRELRLEPGQEASVDSLSPDLEPIERAQARGRALRLLTHREHSRNELAERLRDDGYPGAVVDEVVETLVRSALVDDSRFADEWIRSRARQGYSRERITTELAGKGIDGAVANEALDSALADDEVVRARALLRGVVPTGRKERDRALRRLLGRGFSFATALRAIESDEVVEEDPGASEEPL